MDLNLSPEEAAFRAEVRAFIKLELPPGTREKMILGRELARQDWVDWQRKLNARGWAVPHWPVAWGGRNWSPMQEYILLDELQQAPAPSPLAFNVSMVGPVIAAFGSEQQKSRFLPGTANLDIWWCQGFSEPGAGSDLASLQTKARRDGDHYVLSGQKTWTTLGQHADWIFVLARTDPGAEKKQQGISFILVDLKTPGVAVRPIQLIDGGHEVNEVWFDDVTVPVENLVGQENRGWDYAKFLLGNERMGIAGIGMSKQRIRRIKELAAQERVGDSTLLAQDWFRDKLAALEVELTALEMTQLRVVAAARKRGLHARPDPNSSILKIKGSELQQATTELMMEVVGPYVAPFTDSGAPVGPDHAASAAPTYFNMRKLSIFGGSNEIQHNIVAKNDPGIVTMNFDLSDEQQLLKDGIEKVLAAHYADFGRRKTYQQHPRGFDPAVWSDYAESGILSLPVGQRHGGIGGGPVEIMIVMEQLGRALAIEPFLTSVVLCGAIIESGGSDALKASHLPKLAAGTSILALAQLERGSRHDLHDVSLSCRRVGGVFTLDGEKSVVIGGGAADYVIVSARTAGSRRDPVGISLLLVDARSSGLTRRVYPTQDGYQAAEITFNDVRVPANHLIGPLDGGLPILTRAVDAAIAALCAEAVGVMDVLTSTTVEYLKTRKQFGMPIGGFQALQHRAVDMLVMLEQARSMAIFAALHVDNESGSLRRSAMSGAKVQIGRSARFIGQNAIQLHGAIGVTMEYKAGHYFKRLTMIEQMFGDSDHHLRLLSSAGGLIAAA